MWVCVEGIGNAFTLPASASCMSMCVHHSVVSPSDLVKKRRKRKKIEYQGGLKGRY
jgi:hypothetical protein